MNRSPRSTRWTIQAIQRQESNLLPQSHIYSEAELEEGNRRYHISCIGIGGFIDAYGAKVRLWKPPWETALEIDLRGCSLR